MSKAFHRVALSSLAVFALATPAFAGLSAAEASEKTKAEVPPPTIDSDGDGKPDALDNNGDGKPDAPAPGANEPRGKSE